MDGKSVAERLKVYKAFTDNAINQFSEAQGNFRPQPEMMSVNEQIRHIGHTMKWFEEGVFGSGFDMDFEKAMKEIRVPSTFAEAKAFNDKCWESLIARVEPMTAGQLSDWMDPNPILGQGPKYEAALAALDHAAHHRGALTVYARLLGMIPVMVYLNPTQAK